MKSAKVPARTLATQLLSSNHRFVHFSEVQQTMALDMLTIHIEATRKMGTPGSLKAATTDAVFMASIYEKAYEPIPVVAGATSSSLNNSYMSAWTDEL